MFLFASKRKLNPNIFFLKYNVRKLKNSGNAEINFFTGKKKFTSFLFITGINGTKINPACQITEAKFTNDW